MFIGRSQELEALNGLWGKLSSSFVVCSGRRRIGKTELLDQALNDGRGDYVYLLLTRQTERNLVASLQEDAVRAEYTKGLSGD